MHAYVSACVVTSGQVLDWKRTASLTGNADGLHRFRQALVAASTDEFLNLDLAFEKDGIGRQMLSFVADSETDKSPQNPGGKLSPFQGGLKKIAEGEWLAAYDIFKSHFLQNSFAGPFLSLCHFHLDNMEEAKELIKDPNAWRNPVTHLVGALMEDSGFKRLEFSSRRRTIARV